MLVGDGLLAIPGCSQRGEWNDSGRGRWWDWFSTATVRDVEDKLGANNIATAASQPDQEAAVPRRRLVISTFQRWFRIALRANSTLVKHIPSHYSTMNLYPSRPLGPSRALRVRGHTHAPLRVRAPSCAFDFERRKRSLGGFFSKRARERSVESVLFLESLCGRLRETIYRSCTFESSVVRTPLGILAQKYLEIGVPDRELPLKSEKITSL
jgi:hypothetical protein